ncbi:hypothetical protein B0A55_06946 [Friedmanniomyces simplex]|uniref:Uncharacterized protein n=1 Tax=Friedmanniomyces simplex TaxID=329884 RepID=A0A4U0X7K4_9PEZI|nr:hypothetical protein B0A55_06946 [Friedmanniomyces simplex]
MALGKARRSRGTKPGDHIGRNRSTRVNNDVKSSEISIAASAMLRQAREEAPHTAIGTPKLRVSIDYGTKTLASAILVVQLGDEPTPVDIHTVQFGNDDYCAPQLVAWDESGRFYWGYEVVEALDRQDLKPGAVVGLWKMLLYKNHATSEIADRVRKQLGDHTLDELLTTHFREVLVAVKAWVKSSSPVTADYTDKEIDDLEVEVFLSVPQMWKLPANDRMQTAAKDAGIKHVELVYEPQCAAGYYVCINKHKLPQYLDQDDIALVADVGGGTGDFVSYSFESSSSDGAKVRLQIVGKPEGAMCGSEFVTEEFLKHLRHEAFLEFGLGGFDKLCGEHLGISPAAGISQASVHVENIKKEFSSPKAGTKHIIIYGSQGAKQASWERKINSKQIEGCFARVIEQIFACIDRQMTPRTKVIITPGGFGRTKYFQARLREKYPHLRHQGLASDVVGAGQFVARGALCRYGDISPRGLPSTESLGIPQNEEYDPKVHLDATKKSGGDTRSRFVKVYLAGEYKMPGLPYVCEKWQQYYAYPDDTHIKVQLLWTDADIKTSDRILKNGKGMLEEDAQLRDEIELYGKAREFPLPPDMAALGFELQDSNDGPVYEIYFRLTLTCDGANVKINLQFAMPHSQLYDDEGNFSPTDVELTAEDTREIVAASHNPTPRTAPI